MVTALSLYGTNGYATTLANAAVLVNVTGGTGANEPTRLGTVTGYGEVVGQNSNGWQGLGSIGAPTGNGFLWDVTTLEGQTIIAGTWGGIVRQSVSTGSVTADIYMRAFKYNANTLLYTLIGTLQLLSQTITTTLTQFTMTSGSFPAMSFATAEKLYTDIWWNVHSNSTGSTSTVNNTVASGSTLGLAGRAEWDTPGFQPTPVVISPTIFYQHKRVGALVLA